MSKSSQIIQFTLKDIQSKIHKYYGEHGVEITFDTLEVKRKLFGMNSNSPGWVNEEYASTLHMTGSIKRLGIYEYKNTIISIAHLSIYGRKAGDVELSEQHFGNLYEQGIICRLKKAIMCGVQDWVDAKVKYELPKC